MIEAGTIVRKIIRDIGMIQYCYHCLLMELDSASDKIKGEQLAYELVMIVVGYYDYLQN